MPLRSILISIVAALTLGFAFVACGDDDNSASSSASATATASASDSPDTSGTPKSSSTPKGTSTPKVTATDKPDSTDDASATPEDTTIPDDSTPEIEECDLVELDDLNDAVTGETFSNPGEASSSLTDTCTFTGTGGTTVELSVFNLSVYSDGGEKDVFETFANLFDDEIVDDPGDEAYYDDTLGLSILSSPYELDIVVTKPDQTLDRDASFALAEPALSNMP